MSNFDKTASQIDWEAEKLMDMAIHRSQDLLQEKGRRLSFDDLLASIYLHGFGDAKAAYQSDKDDSK